jgi:hypothetical protein
MGWEVAFHPQFYNEFLELAEDVQDNLLAKAQVLESLGPQLGRPHVDTLFGSRYPNMKELRLETEKGVWRIAFAFDPERKAILLVGGDKAGKPQRKFYLKLLLNADKRFEEHLKNIKK